MEQSHGDDTVNLFKLRAMFQRVQQLLLGRRNRNRAKRAAKRAGSPVYIRRGEVERWVAPWDNATEPPPLLFPPSAPFVSLCHAFFLLFSTLRATVPLKTLNDRTAPREHQRQATIGRLAPSRVAWNCRREPPEGITCTKNYYRRDYKSWQ